MEIDENRVKSATGCECNLNDCKQKYCVTLQHRRSNHGNANMKTTASVCLTNYDENKPIKSEEYCAKENAKDIIVDDENNGDWQTSTFQFDGKCAEVEV